MPVCVVLGPIEDRESLGFANTKSHDCAKVCGPLYIFTLSNLSHRRLPLSFLPAALLAFIHHSCLSAEAFYNLNDVSQPRRQSPTHTCLGMPPYITGE